MMSRAPVNVLYCENNVDGTVGGSYYSLLYLVKGLDRTKYRPLVVFYTQHALLSAYRDAGVETVVWQPGRAYTFGAWRGVPRWLRVPALIAQKALNFITNFLVPSLVRARFLVAHNIAVVHLNNSVLYNHDWMLAAYLTRRTCVTHERGINDHYPRAARFFGKRLSAVICISEAVRENMRRRGADFGNLVTIHNGLDPDALQVHTPLDQLRAMWQLPPDAPVVAMTGNIKSWKGQDTLVRAVDVVRRRFPLVRCLLVGDTSPDDMDYDISLRRLIGHLHLEDRVVFTGFQPNVADFLSLSDVVVHASILPEPFGRVLLEAMACRKPIVAARAGAVPEIVEEGGTGLTFPPGDADALARAIIRLLEDPAEARRMGEKGYRRLTEHFHIRQNLDATQNLYDALLSAAH